MLSNYFKVCTIISFDYRTNARYHKPQFVHLMTHFWSPFLCFQGDFFQKIQPLCMVSIQELFLIKSSLWWRTKIFSQKSNKFEPTEEDTNSRIELTIINIQSIVFCIPHPLNKIATLGDEKLLIVTYLEKFF